MSETAIVLTHRDHARLRELVERGRAQKSIDAAAYERLSGELDRAELIEEQAVPSDVVTMHARVRIRDRDSGDAMTLEVVWPEEADAARLRINVLAPLGMAVLGCRKGDAVSWPTPGGVRRFEVMEVTAPPAAVRNPAGKGRG